jgi:hypothetical protein
MSRWSGGYGGLSIPIGIQLCPGESCNHGDDRREDQKLYELQEDLRCNREHNYGEKTGGSNNCNQRDVHSRFTPPAAGYAGEPLHQILQQQGCETKECEEAANIRYRGDKYS